MMSIQEVLRNLEVNNTYKNKLLMCLLRNHDDYHHNRLFNKSVPLYKLERSMYLCDIVNIILSSNDDILINFLVKSLQNLTV